MPRMRLIRCLAAVSAIVLGTCLTHEARAQEVDYGALEQIFGQPVTTSATGSPQLASLAPANMQIITADDIRRSGATNIPEILNFIAGIDVRNYGALDSDVAIRGFSQNWNPRLLVLLDGRQVYIDDYGYVAWQAIPVLLPEIRQIEIVRGPASALFGFNATSGVINIITYDPLHDANNVVSASYGSDGTLEGALVSTFQQPGKYGIRLSLGGLKTNEYSEARLAGGFTDPHPRMGSFDLDGRWKPTSSTEITADVSDSGADSYAETFYNNSIVVYRTRSYKLGFAADTAFGLVSLQGYVNHVATNVNNFIVTHYDFQNQVGVVQASDLIKFADVHALRFGLEYRSNRGWGAPYGANGGTDSYQDYAADAMWQWQITPQLSWTMAGRIDHLAWHLAAPVVSNSPFTAAEYNAATIDAPSFNAGLVYQPTDADTFRLLAGRGVQAPSLIEDGFQVSTSRALSPQGPPLTVLVGNPDLHPSTLTNFEADYDQALPALQSTASLALYYQVDEDFLLAANDAAAQFMYPEILAESQNFGSATAFGGEFGITGASAGGLRWNASYSLFTVHQRLRETVPAIPYDFSDATPVSAIDFGLGYSAGKWEADLAGKWQSRYTDDSEGNLIAIPKVISNYLTLSARLGYSVSPRLTLAVAGEELTAPQITQTAALPADRRVLFTATYGF